ncbi:MAG: DNA strand exchange inhibitor protein [Planctomycetes bacterium]|nr:DNA strand exchange inhibitor protein [Planctomycetota bacterium]
MNDATMEKLEFHLIRECLGRFSGSRLGKRLAHGMTPSANIQQVREWFQQVREMQAAAESHGLPPMGGVHDIREQVRAAAFPTPLEPETLASIAETLDATVALCRWFGQVRDKAPSLARLETRVTDLSPTAALIHEVIDSRGQVSDYASPKLADIRKSIGVARDRIKGVTDRLLRQAGIAKMLQYAGATFHGDRLVLPLKSEYRGRIKGIIHRSSDTGCTLFVEPAESVELNNAVVRLKDSETKEINRLLRTLSAEVNRQSVPILATLRAIAVVDVIAAKCRYAKKRSCVCPEINDNGVLDIHDARHPILIELFAEQAVEGEEPKEVVPIDVRLGDDFDVLIITGPNTGGKTVAVKTIGLLALMTQCGIPIPVKEGSTLPVYKSIHIDIGDEQSLQQSLSTFSSHLATQLDILQRSGPKSLVLIDELGAGTDPDEGASIGRAIIEELLRLSAKAVVTTHLSSLKAVAFTTQRVDNAAVEFDPQSLRPTFHLKLGEPGNSNALIIAKRLGMPARLVKAAMGFLADSTRALNKAIAGTLDSRREAEQARKAAREAQVDAQRQRNEAQRDRETLRQQQQDFEKWATWVNELGPGDEVFVVSLQRPARVVRMQLQKQKALVFNGKMDIELPLRDIHPVGSDGETV